jgi:glycine betaine catabolism A
LNSRSKSRRLLSSRRRVLDPGQRTLTGHSYRSQEIYDLERERLFHRAWFYVGREERAEGAGARLVVDVAGQSVLLLRGADGELRGFSNVCRHRGAQLCDPGDDERSRAITCPYHGWSYSLDGALIGTPHVGKDEVDRDKMSLWPVAVDTWQGFVFVRLTNDGPSLHDWLAAEDSEPFRFERFGLTDRKVVRTTIADVEANWKVLVENYCECLHCIRIHPQLVDLIPTYRSGSTDDPTRDDHGVGLARDSATYVKAGYAAMAAAAGEGDDPEANSYFGALVFPNMFIDVTGASVVAYTLLPRGTELTTVVAP